MTTQTGVQQPSSSSGKKWFIGCGIALIVVFIALGGFAYWGVKVAKDWGNNPALITLAFALKFDDTYDLVDKDLEANSVTVKESATGEVSVWKLKEFENGSDTIQFSDDKGRTITIGGSSGKAFTLTEPSEVPSEDDETPEVESEPVLEAAP